MGFAGFPSTDPNSRPLPESWQATTPSVCRCQTTDLGPPSWFFTTPTVCSANPAAGLLHPATGHRVRRVSLSALHSSCDKSPSELLFGRSPRRFHPSKKSPTSSRTVSPRPLPSCRYRTTVRGGRPDRQRSALLESSAPRRRRRLTPPTRPRSCELHDGVGVRSTTRKLSHEPAISNPPKRILLRVVFCHEQARSVRTP